MESYKVSLKAVHRKIHVLLGHRRVDHKLPRNRRGGRIIWEWGNGIGAVERLNREVSPDAVRVWIRPDYVFEPAGIDLVIIGGIAPATNAGRRLIEEGGIVHVMRVWMQIVAVSPVMTPRHPRRATALTVLTYCPIPIRRRTCIIALRGEGIFKVLNVISVPREEHSRKVDLFYGSKTVKARKKSNVR